MGAHTTRKECKHRAGHSRREQRGRWRRSRTLVSFLPSSPVNQQAHTMGTSQSIAGRVSACLDTTLRSTRCEEWQLTC